MRFSYSTKHKFSDLFGVGGKRFLQKLKLPGNAQVVLECCLREIGFIEEEKKHIEIKLAKIGRRDRRVKLLMSIPGIDFQMRRNWWLTQDLHQEFTNQVKRKETVT